MVVFVPTLTYAIVQVDGVVMTADKVYVLCLCNNV